MARETRRQRRDARRAAGEQGGNVPRPPRRSTADTAAAGGDGGGSGGGWGGDVSGSGAVAAPPLAHRAGRGRFSFVRESIGELRKVEWPRRPQVVQGTIVVIIACAIVGAFLYAADQALRPFVQHVLLGQ
jgi:preprotein translocase SecE subunit